MISSHNVKKLSSIQLELQKMSNMLAFRLDKLKASLFLCKKELNVLRKCGIHKAFSFPLGFLESSISEMEAASKELETVMHDRNYIDGMEASNGVNAQRSTLSCTRDGSLVELYLDTCKQAIVELSCQEKLLIQCILQAESEFVLAASKRDVFDSERIRNEVFGTLPLTVSLKEAPKVCNPSALTIWMENDLKLN